MKLMIVYGTVEGQTFKIAKYLQQQAEKLGHTVIMYNAIDNPVNAGAYDAVIVGSSIHVGGYNAAVKHFVKENIDALNTMPSAFVSVSLTAAGTDEESWKDLEHITEKFLDEMHWKPALVEQVAGALLYTQYDFFKKFIMRMIAKKSGGSTDTGTDVEYTDWVKVNEFLNKFLLLAQGVPA
jgi:menaquinone-dependent protoporphyrinogen oxidase